MSQHPDPLPESSSSRPSTSWTTPIPRLSNESRLRYALLIVLAALLTMIILPRPARIPSGYVPGDIAARNVKSTRDLLVQDQLLTEQKRSEAYDSVEMFYD